MPRTGAIPLNDLPSADKHRIAGRALLEPGPQPLQVNKAVKAFSPSAWRMEQVLDDIVS